MIDRSKIPTALNPAALILSVLCTALALCFLLPNSAYSSNSAVELTSYKGALPTQNAVLYRLLESNFKTTIVTSSAEEDVLFLSNRRGINNKKFRDLSPRMQLAFRQQHKRYITAVPKASLTPNHGYLDGKQIYSLLKALGLESKISSVMNLAYGSSRVVPLTYNELDEVLQSGYELSRYTLEDSLGRDIFVYAGSGSRMSVKRNRLFALPKSLAKFFTSPADQSIDPFLQDLLESNFKIPTLTVRLILGRLGHQPEDYPDISEALLKKVLLNYYKDAVLPTTGQPLTFGLGGYYIFGLSGTIYLHGTLNDFPLKSKVVTENKLETVVKTLSNNGLKVSIKDLNRKAITVVERLNN